jgi:bacillithiol biosynthesis cysteine-adding enzyme BshC
MLKFRKKGIPFDRLLSSSKLFEDFVNDFQKLSSFFVGDFRDQESYRKVSETIDSSDYPRDQISEILLRQNTAYGLTGQVEANISRLGEPETLMVITGQQVGFLGGTVLSLYKAIGAIKLAEELSGKLSRPVVPAFWMATDDHDYGEVNQLQILNSTDQISKYIYAFPPEMMGRPISEVKIDASIEGLFVSLEKALSDSEFKGAVLEKLRRFYAERRPLLEGFARLFADLFGKYGLILINPAERGFKRLASPLFRREIEEFPGPLGVMEESDRLLESCGYHLQVQKFKPGPNLFLSRDKREPIRAGEAQFVLGESGLEVNSQELLGELKESPERFSPNVLLRPVMQAFLFPTVAYVAGPSEVAYYVQVNSLSHYHGVSCPVVCPRPSATIIEKKIGKALERYGVDFLDFFRDREAVINKVYSEDFSPELEAEADRFHREVLRPFEEYREKFRHLGEGFTKNLERVQSRFDYEMKNLKAKTFQAYKKKNQDAKNQLERAHLFLFPSGRLQERVLSPVYFLNKYGPEFIETLHEALEANSPEHQLIYL